MNWKILGKPKEEKTALRREEIIDILLKNRGLTTKKKVKEFLESRGLEGITPEKVGISARMLKKTIQRIKVAIDNKEKIVVYGDYDADGICGTAILWETLYNLGAQALPFIPDREEEGYGLNKKGIDKLRDASLIITVDNGIVSFEGLNYAKEKGLEVIITDHHLPKTKNEKRKTKNFNFPPALAVLHTTQLSGAGVALVLARELMKQLGKEKSLKEFDRKNTELAAVATIADLCQLQGANRVMVKEGLRYLKKTERTGLLELLKTASLMPDKIEAWQISFIIAPRLNATGRLEDAMDSLRLLCTKSKSQARELAQKLDQINRDRQRLTEETLAHARAFFLKKSDKKDLPPLIFLSHQSYHQGVIGLVAGKLVEEFWRPAMVVSLLDDYAKGSTRSIPGFNIIETLRECDHLLVDVGGHPMAAGFTVEKKNLEELEKTLKKIAKEKLRKELLERELIADCEIKLADITWELKRQLRKFTPFGIGNPGPCFATRGLRIVNSRSVGNGDKHLKLRLDDPGTKRVEKFGAELPGDGLPFSGIAFNFGHLAETLNPGDLVDVCYTIEQNEWNGRKSLELKIKDIKISDE